MEKDTGDHMQLDVVALRCEFSEYDSLLSWPAEYGIDCIDLGVEPDDDDATKEDAIREYISDRGWLIEFDGGCIVSSF